MPYDPFRPVLRNSPSLRVTDEQRMYMREILDICCSDSRFAQKAYDALTHYVLSQVPVPVAPVLTSLTPATAVVGATVPLQVHGTGFTPESQIVWDGTPIPSVFVSEVELSASVDLSTTTVAATYSVSVLNAGGLTSNSLSFELTAPALLFHSFSGPGLKDQGTDKEVNPKHFTESKDQGPTSNKLSDNKH
jgi:hypothetical protein